MKNCNIVYIGEAVPKEDQLLVKDQPSDALTPSSSSSSIPTMLPATAADKHAPSASYNAEWEKEKHALYEQLDQKVHYISLG